MTTARWVDKVKKRIRIEKVYTVKELSPLLGMTEAHLVKTLFEQFGIARTVNQRVGISVAKSAASLLGFEVDETR